jgi:hypothetical protein
MGSAPSKRQLRGHQICEELNQREEALRLEILNTKVEAWNRNRWTEVLSHVADILSQRVLFYTHKNLATVDEVVTFFTENHPPQYSSDYIENILKLYFKEINEVGLSHSESECEAKAEHIKTVISQLEEEKKNWKLQCESFAKKEEKIKNEIEEMSKRFGWKEYLDLSGKRK